MTRRPLIATGAALALVLGLVSVVAAPAASAATAPAIGTVYVADTGNNRVVAVAPDGTQQDVGNGFKNPQGVAVDAAGNVFVADTGNNRVVEIPANGGPQVSIGSFTAPTAVTVGQGGPLYVIDAATNGEVSTINEDGTNQARLTGNWVYGPPVAVTVGFGFIWMLFGGNTTFPPGAVIRIAVADHRDVIVDRENDRIGADAGYLIDPFGTTYQSDTVHNVINATTREIGTGLNDPEGLALTVDGHVVVADTGNNRVEEMAADGSNQTTIGGGFSAPVGVAVYAPPPTFTADSPPDMFAGIPYSYTFKATAPAGEPAPRFQYVGGTALPTGITLDSTTGVLSGTPGGAAPLTRGIPVGNPFQLAVANGASETVVDVNFTLYATEFTAANPPLSTQPGDAYSYQFAAAGSAPVTFSAHPPIGDDNPNALPPGLTLDPATGVLSGTPTAAGAYEFVVRATNSYGYSEAPGDVCCYSLDVVPHVGQPPGVVIYTPADGEVFPLGSSPVGLFSCLAAENTTLAQADCNLYVDGGERRVLGEGLVTTPGPHTVVVTGVQSDGLSTSVTVHYTMGAGAPSVSVTTPTDNASYTVGSVPNVAFTCTAGSGSALKDGTDGCSASIDGGAAVASGAALAATTGPHTVVVTATDTDGQTDSVTRHYTVHPAAGAPSVTVTAPTEGASYTAGSLPDLAFTCTAGTSGTLKDGTDGCSASIDGGAAVASGTALTGTTGAHTVVVTATDTDGQTDSATRHYTVTAAATAVTVTAPSPSITYGDAIPALSPVYSGGPAPSTRATCSTTATATSGAGTYPVTCSGAADPAETFSYVAGTLTIGKARLTVTASSASMNFGANVPAIDPSYSGFVHGDTAASLTTAPGCSTTATSSSPPGTYPSTCAGATSANYTFSYVAGTVTVQKAPVTVFAPSPSITYGDPLPTLAATYAPAMTPTTPATCSTTATASSGAGAYPVTCTGAADADYTFSYVSGTLTIGKAVLTITASDGSMLAGGTVPTVTASYAGFVHGDTAAVLTTAPTCSTTATSSSAPGVYPSSCSGAAAANYTFEYVDGTVTIYAPPIFTSIDNATFTALHANTFTATATGGYPTGPITFTESGALPSGVTFGSDGLLSGTPPVSASGDWPITITAGNGYASATQQFVLTVRAPAIRVPAQAPAGSGMISGVQLITPAGRPVTWTGSGFAPDAPVTVVAYSSQTYQHPVALGTFYADGNGSVTMTVVVPNTVRGIQYVVAGGYRLNGRVLYLTGQTDVAPL